MSEAFYETWNSTVQRVADFVAKDFPDVDSEDISQEMFLWLWESKKFRSPDDPGCSTALYWLGKQTASTYRKQHLTLSAQYSYKTSDLKSILESIFSVEDWAAAFIPEDCKDDTFDDRMSVYSDVAWAYDYLPVQYQSAIYERYYMQVEHPADSRQRRILIRAIDKLVDILNTYSRGRLNRSATTNARARATIEGLT